MMDKDQLFCKILMALFNGMEWAADPAAWSRRDSMDQSLFGSDFLEALRGWIATREVLESNETLAQATLPDFLGRLELFGVALFARLEGDRLNADDFRWAEKALRELGHAPESLTVWCDPPGGPGN